MAKYKVIQGTPVVYYKGEYHFMKAGEIIDAPEEAIEEHSKGFKEKLFEKLSEPVEKTGRKKQKSESDGADVSSEDKSPEKGTDEK